MKPCVLLFSMAAGGTLVGIIIMSSSQHGVHVLLVEHLSVSHKSGCASVSAPTLCKAVHCSMHESALQACMCVHWVYLMHLGGHSRSCSGSELLAL